MATVRQKLTTQPSRWRLPPPGDGERESPGPRGGLGGGGGFGVLPRRGGLPDPSALIDFIIRRKKDEAISPVDLDRRFDDSDEIRMRSSGKTQRPDSL
jgi:hypothetical protein